MRRKHHKTVLKVVALKYSNLIPLQMNRLGVLLR